MVDRLEPEERELDGMFAAVRLCKEEARGIGLGGKMIDEVRGATGAPERRDIIAMIEVPLKRRAMADAENQISVGERFIEQGSKSGGIGAEADPKIDVRRDDTSKSGFLGRRRQLIGRKGIEGVAEKGEAFGGVRGIAVGMMLSIEKSHDPA